MLRKITLILSFLICFSFAIIYSQEVNYEGCWGVANGDYTGKKTYEYLTITKIPEENKYFVISIDRKNPLFTFYGGGFLRHDGFLQITTSLGHVWVLTPAFSARHSESIGLTDINNIESFGIFVRVEEKFDVWPYPSSNRIGIINSDSVFLYSEPDFESHKYSEFLNFGSEVEILNQSENEEMIDDMKSFWYQVLTSDDSIAWIYGWYLDVQ